MSPRSPSAQFRESSKLADSVTGDDQCVDLTSLTPGFQGTVSEQPRVLATDGHMGSSVTHGAGTGFPK